MRNLNRFCSIGLLVNALLFAYCVYMGVPMEKSNLLTLAGIFVYTGARLTYLSFPKQREKHSVGLMG